MPLAVGNLLIDPEANSFISLTDAVDFLAIEAGGAAPETPIGAWISAGEDAQEASLATASRWLAGAVNWCRRDLDALDLQRVGRIVARLAISALSTDLYGSADVRGPLRRVKAGSAEIEWAGSGMAAYQAGGRYWPWLKNELRGLICSDSSRWLLRV